jgi:hypothetical protein
MVTDRALRLTDLGGIREATSLGKSPWCSRGKSARRRKPALVGRHRYGAHLAEALPAGG